MLDIAFSISADEWQNLQRYWEIYPPSSIGGRSGAAVSFLQGEIQISQFGTVLFSEAAVRRSYRVEHDQELEAGLPGKGFRIALFDLALSLDQLLTKEALTVGENGFLEQYSDPEIGFSLTISENPYGVGISASIPNVSQDELPVIEATVSEFKAASVEFIRTLCKEAKIHVPFFTDWPVLKQLEKFSI